MQVTARKTRNTHEIYSSGKIHFNLTAKEKLELHFEVESADFMFTFTSSGHSKNNHKTFLESVATSSQEVEMVSIAK